MKNLIANIKKLIFKSRCAACNVEETEKDNRICNECLKKLKYSSSLKNRGSLFYIWKYEGIIKNITEAHKFNGIRDISIETADIIREKLIFLIEEYNVEVVIPVPISKKRERERGFNQAEDILSEAGIKWIKAERVKETEHMYKILDKNEREKNIKKSFKINESESLDNKSILIFDDIVTTGATFFEIKKEINKNCTPKQIIFFALAASNYSMHKGVDSNGNE